MPACARRKRWIYAWALSALLSPSLSALPPEDAVWTRFDTASFTLLSVADREETWRLGGDLERLRATLAVLFPGVVLTSPKPSYVYVFDEYESFAPYRMLSEGTARTDRTYFSSHGLRFVPDGTDSADPAYFVSHPHGDYMAVLLTGSVNPRALLYKPYLHEVLSLNLPTLPLWLRYGLVEFFSTFDSDDELAYAGRPPPEHLHWLRYGKLLPAGELTSFTALPAKGDERTVFLAESWAFAHYLLLGEHRPRVLDFIRRLRRGEAPDAAFDATFRPLLDDPAALDRALADYARQTRFNVLHVRVERPSLAAVARPLSRAELLFRLGDLLIHASPERSAEAAAHFRAALASDPDHGPAHAGLGYVAELAGDHQRAARSYARAAALAPDDFLVQYLYGESLLRRLGHRRPADDEQQAVLDGARSAFARSVELRPDYAEAWARLGFAYELDPRPSPASIEALERAAELLPGRWDVAFNLLLACARAGEDEKAEQLVARLRATGAGEDQLARANEVLMQLAYRRANRLAGRERLDDAVALLGRVVLGSRDEELRARAEQQLATFAQAARHNRFAARYLEALGRYREGDLEAARAMLEALAGEATNGRQREAVTILLQEVAGDDDGAD
ncbi:MAG: hypothetical protein D6696_12170 [Acidobacteria bacterium]|nr:MAG: hypothetical protein D6696_12170 [Acidobacteriota bacterium]